MTAAEYRSLIREVPDFPKPGILFYDITTLLKDPNAYRDAIREMLEPYRGEQLDIVVGMESRGFIFSAPMAYQLGAGLVPVRKLGKLPAETITVEDALAYGSRTPGNHRDPRPAAGPVPVRTLGNLPAETITVEYALEYGSNTLEIHRDAIQAGQKVLIVDDLLATGGAGKAARAGTRGRSGGRSSSSSD